MNFTRIRFAAITAALLLITAASRARSDVRAEKMDYKGWRGSWRLSNGAVELVFVPQIGRIMRFGRIGGPNMLWENPDMAGKAPERSSKDWDNFGGDKVWPAPQSRWGWPPDKDIDPGQHSVEALPGGKLRVTGGPSTAHGIRFIREISLAPDRAEAAIVNVMENTTSKSVDWSIWEVAQVNDPQWAEIPVDKSGGWNFFDDPSVGERGLSTKGSIPRGGASLRLSRDSKKNGKIGTVTGTQWARARIGDHDFTILGPNRQPGEYPDKGCLQELYSSPDPAKYMELELLSPIHSLKPGERATFTTRWQLDKAKGN